MSGPSGAVTVWASAAKARWQAHEASCQACGIRRQLNGMCPLGREILENHEAAQREYERQRVEAAQRVILANGADTLSRALAEADADGDGLTGLSYQEMADRIIAAITGKDTQ